MERVYYLPLECVTRETSTRDLNYSYSTVVRASVIEQKSKTSDQPDLRIEQHCGLTVEFNL